MKKTARIKVLVAALVAITLLAGVVEGNIAWAWLQKPVRAVVVHIPGKTQEVRVPGPTVTKIKIKKVPGPTKYVYVPSQSEANKLNNLRSANQRKAAASRAAAKPKAKKKKHSTKKVSKKKAVSPNSAYSLFGLQTFSSNRVPPKHGKGKAKGHYKSHKAKKAYKNHHRNSKPHHKK